MKRTATYPSKVMLVGEYGVVLGGSALTIPFHRYSARVRGSEDIPEEKAGEARLSRRYLTDLYRYISTLPGDSFHARPNLDLFSGQLEKYWLEMNIPTGYGLGSSGAVSAAIYDMFFPEARNISLSRQKEDLATIESFFHGKSSGVDALTCHAGTALHVFQNGEIRKASFCLTRASGSIQVPWSIIFSR